MLTLLHCAKPYRGFSCFPAARALFHRSPVFRVTWQSSTAQCHRPSFYVLMHDDANAEDCHSCQINTCIVVYIHVLALDSQVFVSRKLLFLCMPQIPTFLQFTAYQSSFSRLVVFGSQSDVLSAFQCDHSAIGCQFSFTFSA